MVIPRNDGNESGASSGAPLAPYYDSTLFLEPPLLQQRARPAVAANLQPVVGAIEPPSSVYHRLPFAYREMLCHCRSFPYPPLPAPVVFCTKFTHSYHVHSITDQFPFYFTLTPLRNITYKIFARRIYFFLSLVVAQEQG